MLNKKRQEEILADVKANGFKVFPPPREGQEYGPLPKQREAIEIPHKHDLDVVLMYGGARGSKSAGAVAAGISYMLRYPGIDIMIGCEQYKHLERTALNDYKKLFTVVADWDHPLILPRGGKPTTHDKTIKLINGSTCWCMHFADYTILRGANLGFAHIEEASLLKDKSVMGEVLRRMSNNRVKQKQIFLTSNPEETHGWLYDEFKLEQFEPGYEGPPIPIRPPCNCQYCQTCLNMKVGEFLYNEKGFCPECNGKKETDCPGNQDYWRVIFVDSTDNAHLSQSYRQTQKLSTSAAEFALYSEGQVIELRAGKVYEPFKRKHNVLPANVPLDYDLPLFWNHDFNISFMCSDIIQEVGEDPIVFDEIVIPEKGPKEAAIEFLNRYGYYNQTIYLIFDPAAFNRSITGDDGGIRIKIMRDVLENPQKYGFPDDVLPKHVVELTRKEEGQTKVLVSSRVDSVNTLLDDGAENHRLKINPSCVWTIRSLEALKWAENNGKPVIDVSVDKAAAKHPDKSTVRTLSHPTDALGYYVYKRFPVVSRKLARQYAYLPGAPGIETDPEGVFSTREEPVKEKEDPKLVFTMSGGETDPTKVSLLKFLELGGAFDQPEDNPFLGFW
jgi:hypothetical protein